MFQKQLIIAMINHPWQPFNKVNTQIGWYFVAVLLASQRGRPATITDIRIMPLMFVGVTRTKFSRPYFTVKTGGLFSLPLTGCTAYAGDLYLGSFQAGDFQKRGRMKKGDCSTT
jgi:hypothetical protein